MHAYDVYFADDLVGVLERFDDLGGDGGYHVGGDEVGARDQGGAYLEDGRGV